MGTVYIAFCDECKQILEFKRKDNHTIYVVPCRNKECISNINIKGWEPKWWGDEDGK